MDYYDRIRQSVEFIEANLESPLTPERVSREIYSSLPHFYRIFTAMTGYSVKEYIRKRRLSCAAHDLLSTKQKIIDIALKFQYTSPECFSRAFRRTYGVNPADYRRTRKEQELFEKIDIYINKIDYSGAYAGEPRFVTAKSFKIIGPELRAAFQDGQEAKKIPLFWERFFNNRTAANIPSKIDSQIFYGVYKDWNEIDALSLIACYEVEKTAKPPKGMVLAEIPPSKYAVFTTKGPLPDCLVATWRYIYGEWFPKTCYERVKGFDFERYDSRVSDTRASEVEIFIPVK